MRIIVDKERAEAYFADFYNGVTNFDIVDGRIEFDVDSKKPFIPKEWYVREIQNMKNAITHMDGGLAFAHEVIAGAIQGYEVDEEDLEEDEDKEDIKE